MPSRATHPRNRFSIYLLFYCKSTNTDAELAVGELAKLAELFYYKSTNTDAELAVGELAKLAELTAHSEETRKKTPMLHTLLERREFLLAEMQEKLRAALEEVVLLYE